MISKQRIKFIKSLQYKKYRKKEQAFLVEGEICVKELINSDFEILFVVATPDFLYNNPGFNEKSEGILYEADAALLHSVGTLKTNEKVLAVARIPESRSFTILDEYVIALDGLQDPGNLGTVIRIADWYGIKKILISDNSVDLYNPKVIHATMGSFVRVQLYYCNLPDTLRQFANIEKYGAYMQGENIHRLKISSPAIIITGNEAHGISTRVSEEVNHRIHIPRIGGAESLNAAVATAIICDNVFRDH